MPKLYKVLASYVLLGYGVIPTFAKGLTAGYAFYTHPHAFNAVALYGHVHIFRTRGVKTAVLTE
jgi:hypothetical protein